MARQTPRSETSGPLEGHIRKGRRFYSNLAYTGVLEIGDWVRDDLPDLVWPVLALSQLGSGQAIRFVHWQRAVQRDLAGEVDDSVLADCLDGRLTALDHLRGLSDSAEHSIKSRAQEYELLAPATMRAIASYPEHTASWFFDSEFIPPGKAELTLLRDAIVEAITDGHREAILKCLSIWSAVQAGVFRSSQDAIDILKVYPNDPSTRSLADSMIRASWGAHRGALLAKDASACDSSIRWARVFWDVNSMTTKCIRTRDIEGPGSADEEHSEAPENVSQSVEGPRLREFAMDLMSSYCQALESSPGGYDSEPQEVHAGLVSRACRDVITALGAPDLWCLEHGSHITRVLVETRIYLQWMATQEVSIYREFQEYGAGKAKLYARIFGELEEATGAPHTDEAIREFERLSHNSDLLDHRVVDTRDSFAGGKSIRAMAEECGLLNVYRTAYYVSSGVAHSEWWSIEEHCLERCRNVLHRGHLIPTLSLNAGNNEAIAKSWIDYQYNLIRSSLDILEVDQSAIGSAFSWLSERTDAQKDK